MSQAKISLLLPTYQRPAQLKLTLESIHATVLHPETLEIIIHAVVDDTPTLDMLDWEDGSLLISNRVGYSTLPKTLNAMAALSTGDWLFPFADDVRCNRRGWDRILTDYDHTVPTLVIGGTNGLWFPAISRTAYRAIGCVTQSQFHDVWLMEAFIRAGLRDRVFPTIPARFTDRVVCGDSVQNLSEREGAHFEATIEEAASRLRGKS